ncbi:MAG: hemolysin family protein [Actinomycetota bacterium]|nr:hemolysin family protein [Actinomycetota bacterium]
MADLWIELALVFLLIAINAILAGSEMAFVTLREAQIDRLAKRKGAGRSAAELARNPNRFLATVQIGITLAGFLASATAAVSIAEPLVESLGFMGDAAEPVAVILVTLVLSYLSLVFGELAPKRVALQRAEGWVTLFARPLVITAAIARPIVWLLSRSTDLAVRLMGGDPAVRKEEISKAELREIVSSRPGLHRLERTIMAGALQIAERSLREIVVPRPTVTSVQAEDTVEEALAVLLRAGVSRAPVTRTNIDDVVGVVHLRDLIGKSGPVGEVARDALALPESLSVMKALNEMQKARTHLAIVVDEYGGTEGIVTIENILEEVVGEIYDEFDRDVLAVRKLDDDSFLLRGDFPLHDLDNLEVRLTEGDYSTISGLVMHLLGRVAQEGDRVTDGGWDLEVVRTSGRTIDLIKLTKASRPE